MLSFIPDMKANFHGWLSVYQVILLFFPLFYFWILFFNFFYFGECFAFVFPSTCWITHTSSFHALRGFAYAVIFFPLLLFPLVFSVLVFFNFFMVSLAHFLISNGIFHAFTFLLLGASFFDVMFCFIQDSFLLFPERERERELHCPIYVSKIFCFIYLLGGFKIIFSLYFPPFLYYPGFF